METSCSWTKAIALGVTGQTPKVMTSRKPVRKTRLQSTSRFLHSPAVNFCVRSHGIVGQSAARGYRVFRYLLWINSAQARTTLSFDVVSPRSTNRVVGRTGSEAESKAGVLHGPGGACHLVAVLNLLGILMKFARSQKLPHDG